MLEARWVASAREADHEVRVVRVDDAPMNTYFASLIEADNIVFTCFTFKLARIAALLRREAQTDARYFIYLHNQATIGCWPFHAYGMGEILRSTDIFLASCAFDIEALRRSFMNARAEIVPFTLPDAETFPSPFPAIFAPTDVRFVFAGRVSGQKNLHTLFLALRRLIDMEPSEQTKLVIYGEEDHLGSPNMGMRQRDYLDQLKSLACALKIEPHVLFAGHLQRDELHARLASENFVFVSPSLHSDENFGMAAFRALCLGRSAVLTRWGGHAEYARHFAGQVHEVPVHGSDSGPWISSAELALAMSAARRQATSASSPTPNIPDAFNPERISQRVYELATSPKAASQALEISAIAREVLARQKEFSRDTKSDPCRIFESYGDPLAANFFKAYGMRELMVAQAHPSVAHLVPWASIVSGKISIHDPHRGEFVFPTAPADLGVKAHSVIDAEGTSIEVSEAVMSELIRGGFAERTRNGMTACPAK